jgi:hypothetical protein
MNVFDLPFAVFAFFALVAIIPAAMHWSGQLTGQPLVVQLFANMSLGAIVLLTIASWLQPGGA